VQHEVFAFAPEPEDQNFVYTRKEPDQLAHTF